MTTEPDELRWSRMNQSQLLEELMRRADKALDEMGKYKPPAKASDEFFNAIDDLAHLTGYIKAGIDGPSE